MEGVLKSIHDYQRSFYKGASNTGIPARDQEDLYQEFNTSSSPTHRLKVNRKISTWMYRIALNTAMAMYRKNRVPVPICCKENFLIISHSYNDTGNTEETEALMFDALRKLNDAERPHLYRCTWKI